MSVETEIETRFLQVRARVEQSAQQAGRDPKLITIVAVSKKQPIEKLVAYQNICIKHGLTPVFGENYVQEFRDKLPRLTIPWQAHLIGPLQRNKVTKAVELFDCIQSVHTPEIAQAISAAAQKRSKVQEVFLQVNISNDPAKSGFAEQGLEETYQRLSALPGMRIAGLMTITMDYENAEDARPDFASMRNLRSRLAVSTLKLSMGMSQDFTVAIQEGADIIRVGTALFGPREE